MARSDTYVYPAMIAVGQSIGPTTPINFNDRTPKRIYIPANTEGAGLIFLQAQTQAQVDASALLPTYDTDGNLIEIPISAGRVVELNPALLAGARYLQIQTTDGAGTPVAQTGAAAAIEIVGVGF